MESSTYHRSRYFLSLSEISRLTWMVWAATAALTAELPTPSMINRTSIATQTEKNVSPHWVKQTIPALSPEESRMAEPAVIRWGHEFHYHRYRAQQQRGGLRRALFTSSPSWLCGVDHLHHCGYRKVKEHRAWWEVPIFPALWLQHIVVMFNTIIKQLYAFTLLHGKWKKYNHSVTFGNLWYI